FWPSFCLPLYLALYLAARITGVNHLPRPPARITCSNQLSAAPIHANYSRQHRGAQFVINSLLLVM
ncbi:MAG: hypothetical protein NWR95_11555, partial [Gammaproteobacteria bacterium]|nr:hypothetical protein [Gammaproteobacteria bacterium]